VEPSPDPSAGGNRLRLLDLANDVELHVTDSRWI
jgi:hypothetical protein